MTLITDLAPAAGCLLDAVPLLIDRTFPLAERFKKKLPQSIAELSRLLTSGRGERGASYLEKPEMLQAYLRYFLPWNLYRLSRLLPGLSLELCEGDAVTDLGSGPLTLPLALWISRPDLRSVPLEFRCIDRAGAVLRAGRRFFAALAEFTTGAETGTPWRFKTAAAALGAPVRGKPAALVTAVNVFNELYEDLPYRDHAGLAGKTRAYAGLLCRDAESSVLVVEPGVPRAGEFIACLRTALAEKGRLPLAPCPHAGPCPCPGGFSPGGKKTRWCHFAFDTAGAPADLHRLSAAAGIPKERAALSFLFSGSAKRSGKTAPAARPAETAEGGLPVRVLSDPFPVEGGNLYGRYGCSEKGLVLVRGEKSRIGALVPGSLFTAESVAQTRAETRDRKSGAFIIDIGAAAVRTAGTAAPASFRAGPRKRRTGS
ncbi:MAG: rRNA methyltransferase [Treponema sp.]|nr:rRNA methyltransferase [Treponema sp.]